MSVSNCSATVPVILLARMGPARERLREAVIAAGGELLQEEDPTLLGPDALQAQAATVVLVALEPAIEDALERLDTVLESPHLTLIFDEAELAARREGWEAQRWIRHLSAKLRGHDNVLPPGPEHEPSAPPAMPVSADALPVAPAPAPVAAEAEAAAWSPSHEVLADETAVSWPSPAAPLSPWQRSPEPLGEEPADTWQAQPPSSPQVIDPLQDEPASAWSPSVVPSQAAAAPAPELPPLPFAAPVRSAAPVEPPPLPPLPDAPATVAAPATKDFNSWALVEDDALIVSTTRPQATPQLASFLTTDLSLLEVDDGGAAGSGAVLLLAGIGGPDALRRFLGALPASFARPVLVQMRLDGGRYGNLVKQMARVAALPVLLAEPGTVLEAGNVYVLPDAVGIAAGNGVLEFVSDASESVIEVLPAADSAVVMLSGAAPERVEATLALAAQGGWVAGQVSEGCYDPAAALRLAEQGMNTGDPVYLANALCERWGG